MLILMVLAAWLALAFVVSGLFVALVRGGGGTDAAETEPMTPGVVVHLPSPRTAATPAAALLARRG